MPENPLIFVLSVGVDPTRQLQQLAERRGMGAKLSSCALGQGQAPLATRLINEGAEHQAHTRVPLFAARTLNATGQARVTLSLR